MEVLEVRQRKLGDITYQCKVLNKLNINELVLTFNQNSSIPSIKIMNNLIGFLDQVIEADTLDILDKTLVLELQIILVSAIVGGVFPEELLKLDVRALKNHKTLNDFKYLNYLIKEVQSNNNNEKKIFTVIKMSLLFENLNLFLILNGIETTLSDDKLRILYGRYHYLSHGNLSGVRYELCKNLGVKDHLGLLAKLKLIDSYQLRND